MRTPALSPSGAATFGRDRDRRALVLVDVINGFFDERGEFFYPDVRDVLPGIAALLEAARRGGRLIVHSRDVHYPGLADFEWLKLPEHSLAGDFNAEPYIGFEARPGEIEMRKRRYSAFFATDLALLLAEQRVGEVIFAGVKTNVCIRATVEDAFAHGFRPTVVREAVNSNRPHLHAASLEDIGRYFGDVKDLATALSWLREGVGDG